MVKIALQIKATLENIEELQTCHPHYAFFVRIKCTNCGEVSDKWHDITEGERVNEDTRNPKGFNFYMKCRMCFRENSIDIVEGSNVSYMADDSGKMKTIVAFDCRGVELIQFSPRTGWIARASENGTTFEDVDLSKDDWVEYDQKNNTSLGVYEFESHFIKIKK
ncbi:UPF0587 protein GA18326 isoform X1 [Malaya genurostris]|uniref:UPF0587 protein GA18326 isoform X1 n=1 Tax=Malaya genurostris TaxID=325434 RepID=UPI0026F3E3BA|nr:UPF0587 protein GA18326 isoform X1 [Malaya genurostris]